MTSQSLVLLLGVSLNFTSSPLPSYTYDSLSQLTQVDYPGSFAFADTSFSLDPVGNRTQVTAGGTTSYTPNRLNQYTQVGSTAFTYDANGNLTSDGSRTYTYDSENRLVSTVYGLRTMDCTYDPFGRRLSKTVDGVATYFLYDGEQVIAETDGNGALTASYVFGPGIDEPLTMTRGGTTHSYHTDGLGSIVALTNASGAVVERYSYDVYGAPSITDGAGSSLSASALGNRFMFTGREYDQETGLYYYRHRYYDPRIGRFLSRDYPQFLGQSNLYTYVGSVGKPLPYFKPINETNAYLYTGNNPITRIDPLGLWYLDVNVGLGWWGLGGTGGILIGPEGIYSYGGGGVAVPGFGASITWSPQNPSPGWNVGAQVNAIFAGQYGYSFSKKNGCGTAEKFWEVGVGAGIGSAGILGGSVTGYYVQEPWLWPWNQQ